MRALVLVFAFVCAAAPAGKKTARIHGYVTAIHSPASFDIDDYRINCDAPVAPGGLRIGAEVVVRGEYDARTRGIRPREIRIIGAEARTIRRSAPIERAPNTRRQGKHWEGELRADGERIVLDRRTRVTVRGRKAPEGTPLRESMFVSYEGTREEDGRIRAARIDLRDNQRSPAESRLWKQLAVSVKAPGELLIGMAGKFPILRDSAVQLYAGALGRTLVPESQREMAAGDEGRIPFRFFVVDNPEPNAFSCANGTVVIYSGLLRTVQNEAQLAFVVGHEIAHTTHKHTIRQIELNAKDRSRLAAEAGFARGFGTLGIRNLLSLATADLAAGYRNEFENQADRVGMEYMSDAGYDPREAPRVWKAIAAKSGDRAFWHSRDDLTVRKSYLMSELGSNYGPADFASKKRDSKEFRAIVSRLEK